MRLMGKSFVLFVLLAVTGFNQVLGEEVRIGYIDLQKIVDTSKNAIAMSKSFKGTVKEESRRLEAEGEKLKKAQQELEKESLVMSEAQLENKQKELMLKVQIFQQDRAKTQVKMEKERLELNKQLLDRVRKHVEDLAKRKNLTVVYEKGESGLVYIDPTLDLTSEVIERLDRE